MKIIVTGCRGQLGTEIIKQLREGRSELGPIPEKLVSATVIPVDLPEPVSYTHLRAHETDSYLVCRLLLEKKKKNTMVGRNGLAIDTEKV